MAEASTLDMVVPRIEERSRIVAIWLFAVAFIVFAMVAVGGATRLTGSGLSITQWRPLNGALPPLSPHAWNEAFRLYRATPQYRLVNPGMSLDAFKFIFWWEWGHRLLGRLIGLAFVIPCVLFAVTRRLPSRLLVRCIGLLGLGALQGLIGWWMVESGLETRVSVAPERLAVHLSVALFLLSALVWTGLEAWTGKSLITKRDRWTIACATLAGLVFLQCLLGALVAGNHGGLVENDWPWMAGRLFPADYWTGSLWGSVAHGAAASQFDHRLGAYFVFTIVTVLAWLAVRSSGPGGRVKAWALATAAAVWLQVGLGVATLLAGAPITLAILHQAVASVVLVMSVVLAWRSRRC